MIKGIKVVLKENTLLDVYFSDGSVKRYDVLSLSDKFPQLNVLKNRSLFEKGKMLGYSCVYWNDEIDIDVETIYDEGIDVTSEYEDIDNVLFGFQIKEKRLSKYMTQEDLARITHIDQGDLSKIEKGNANPSLKTLFKILKALDSDLTLK